MTPKTERFEMRLEPVLLERVDEWRSGQSDLPSRAEAIRRLIEDGVAKKAKEKFRPTHAERLIIWLLTELLKNQKGHAEANLIQDALLEGHFWYFDDMGCMHDDIDDPSSLSLVINTLEMWWFIENAYRKFSAADKKRVEDEIGYGGKDPKFLGFDGNHETAYMSIAQFLLKTGRFTDFKGRDFNSHMPTVGRYSRMCTRFAAMRPHLTGGRGLNVDEVIELLKRE
jgi:uncharacterized protein YfbU (UPF0304 family)